MTTLLTVPASTALRPVTTTSAWKVAGAEETLICQSCVVRAGRSLTRLARPLDDSSAWTSFTNR